VGSIISIMVRNGILIKVKNKEGGCMEDYKEKIISTLQTVKRDGIERLITYLENESDYFTAPASTKYHNNFVGGLAEHSYKVMEILNQKNQQFNLNIPLDSIIICGLLHDLCKCNFYVKGKKNVKEGKKPDGRDNWVEKEVWEIDDQLPLGHGSKSIIILQRFIPMSEFEVLAINFHMGIPEDYEMKNAYNKATEKYPAIITLHTADLESSYLLEKIIK
jgi:hypothetical protein